MLTAKDAVSSPNFYSPVQEQVLCLTLTLSNKDVLKMPGPIFSTACVRFSPVSHWTAVLFPAGTVSNTAQTGRLLPAPVIKGQWCAMVIWVRAGVEKGEMLDPGSHARASVHIMNLPLVLITYWYESLARLFTGNDCSAILPFFPINGSGSPFQHKRGKQTFLSLATLSYVSPPSPF